jgi:hypothetical protein
VGTPRGGRSLLSSDVGVDGSSASSLLSPADDEAGTGDGGDKAEAEAESSDCGGGRKGTVLMGGSSA